MSLWAIVLPALLGLGAVYLLLPRPRGYPVSWGAAAAALALLLGGVLLIEQVGASVEAFLFYVFSGVAIVSGGLLVTQRHPARAALSFALVVLSTCGLFLLRAAPFLMAATTIIYAGAIIVTFLFVLMLAQQSGNSDADHRSREPFLASLAGFVLLAALLFVLQRGYDTHRLDDLIARANRATEQRTVDEIDRTLGNNNQNSYFEELGHQLRRARGSRDRASVEDDVKRAEEDWPSWREENNVAEMRRTLARLADESLRVRESVGTLSVPGAGPARSTFAVPPAGSNENVAPLGRALFTDYLLAVELGGTLLLVATVGAIVIASRRTEGLR